MFSRLSLVSYHLFTRPSLNHRQHPPSKQIFQFSTSMTTNYAAKSLPLSTQVPITSGNLASLSTIISDTAVEAWLGQSTSPPSLFPKSSPNSLKRKFRHHSWPLLESSPVQKSPEVSLHNMTEPGRSGPHVSTSTICNNRLPSLTAG